MKGPGFRLDLDVRRIWECPACGKRLKQAGEVTQIDCDCRHGAPVAMRLVEPRHCTESPFDHVGFAAQKRIDEALRKNPLPQDVEPCPVAAPSDADSAHAKQDQRPDASPPVGEPAGEPADGPADQ